MKLRNCGVLSLLFLAACSYRNDQACSPAVVEGTPKISVPATKTKSPPAKAKQQQSVKPPAAGATDSPLLPQAAEAPKKTSEPPSAPKKVVYEVTADKLWGLGLSATSPAKVTPVASSGDLPARVVISDVPAGASPGGQPMVALPIPGDIESLVSGKQVRVTISARSGDTSPSSVFAASYSTNDVGNSGWTKFDIGPTFAPYSFTYLIPSGKSSGRDFVGFLPDAQTGAGAVEVRSVTIEIVDR